jgi:alkylation response protein AidB-like acyl-CoA dehydrogenase
MPAVSTDPLWLEKALGDPFRATDALGFAHALRLDEREEFPEEAASTLDALGLCAMYVPEALGGRLASFEHLAASLCSVARRDLTLAIGHGKTVLGSQPVFLAGDPAIARLVADRVLAGEPIALALTERHAGADLLACRTEASPRQGGYALSGEKWLVNNATRASALSVFARTSPREGPRGFSMLFADKGETEGAHRHLPKIRTHGIRGADISGIRYDDARCTHPPLGGEGAGLPAVLKTFCITRTLVASLAVGALDTAIRIVLRFARERALFGTTVVGIPHARAVLARAIADLLTCEAASLAGARVLQCAPEQAAFWSSVLKYAVPVTVERAMRDLAVVFGARHYLREGDAAGAFQKIERDVALLGVFDGSTLVNLHAVALHGRLFARSGGAAGFVESGATDLAGPVAPLDPPRLSMMGRDVVRADALARFACDALASRPEAERARERLLEHARAAEAGHEAIAASVPRSVADMTPAVVERAARHARVALTALAGAACARFEPAWGDVARRGDWLVLAGEDAHAANDDDSRERLLDFALARVDAGLSLTLFADRADRAQPITENEP